MLCVRFILLFMHKHATKHHLFIVKFETMKAYRKHIIRTIVWSYNMIRFFCVGRVKLCQQNAAHGNAFFPFFRIIFKAFGFQFTISRSFVAIQIGHIQTYGVQFTRVCAMSALRTLYVQHVKNVATYTDK